MSKRPTLADVEVMQARNRAAWHRQVVGPAPVETPPERVDRMAVSSGRVARMPVPTETDECRVFIAWTKLVRFRGRPLWDRVVKIPNERGKAGASIGVLASIGMRTGFPDYDILAPYGMWHGLYLEAKRIKGSDTTDDQRTWKADLIEFGYYAEICLGADELIAATRRYFDLSGATDAGLFIDTTRAKS